MVLHLRRLIAVISALIVMMGAMPAFAAEEEGPATSEYEQTEVAAPEETQEAAKADQPEKASKPEKVESAAQTEKAVEESSLQAEADFVYLTFTDKDNVRLIDEETFEISEGTNLKEFLEDVMKDMELECQWDSYSIECNKEPVDNEKPKELILKSEDKLVISIEKDEAEKSAESEDSIIMSAQAGEDDISNSGSKAAAKTADIMKSSDWAWGSEWGLIGISRLSDISSSNADKYCASLAGYLAENGSEYLSKTGSSDNARTVLAVTALGYDPTDVNGYNLLAPLADFEYASKPYLSGPVWTLIAVDSHGYSIPEAGEGKTQTTRELLIKKILGEQKDAGWSFSGRAPDVDMTSMVIQALAPYYGKDNEAVNEAVDKAVVWLSKAQNTNGGYKSYGKESSESASQVIAALTAIGINPNTDSRFIKNGKSVVDSLLSFRTSDGGFKHLSSEKKFNNLATYQGCYALTAYARFVGGRTSLYDMSDVELKKFAAEANPEKKSDDSEKKEQEKKAAAGATLALGKTFSLGGKTVSLKLPMNDKENLTAEETAESTAAADSYNAEAEKNKLRQTLPWVYGGIAALAALALTIVLRNRKPE